VAVYMKIKSFYLFFLVNHCLSRSYKYRALKTQKTPEIIALWNCIK